MFIIFRLYGAIDAISLTHNTGSISTLREMFLQLMRIGLRPFSSSERAVSTTKLKPPQKFHKRMENYYETLVDIHLSASRTSPKLKPVRNLKLLERKCRPILLRNETLTDMRQVESAARSIYGDALKSNAITTVVQKFNETAKALLTSV